MRICQLVLLVALVAVVPAHAQTPAPTAPAAPVPLFDEAAIERLVQESMAKSGAPSYVVGLVVGDRLVYANAFGLADVGQNRPATVDTIYQVGSLTKTFTATLLCALRDDGKLRLDDPVSQFLPPEVTLPTDPLGAPAITLRHLATHTSGLPSNPVNRRDVPDSPSVMMPYSARELYDGLPHTRLDAPVGARWRYSNLGVGLLGHALERAGGAQYEALLKRRLLDPLRMTNTTVTLSDEQLDRFATHYWYGDASRAPRQRWIFGEVCAFGGVASTVPDLAKYVVMYLRQGVPEAADGPVVRGATLRELCAPQRMISPRWRQANALGWFVERTDQDVELVAHGGEVDGNSSFVAFAPQLGVGAIVLANTGRDAATIVGEPLIQQMIRAAAADRARALELVKAESSEETIEALQAVVTRAPADGEAWAALGVARLSAGRHEPALAAFRRAVQLGHNRMNSAYNAACAAARAGMADEAFTWLAAARSHGFRDREQAERDPDLASLRGDPRWQDALPR
jgi:CubicO group peptidase (beta-lactamase class C family)